MQKSVILLTLLLLIPLSQAAILEVNAIDEGSVVVKQLSNPAKFTLQIRNVGESDAFEIYSFLGVTMYPKGNFYLEGGKTTSVEIQAVPGKDVRRDISGYYIFEYQIRSPKNGITKNNLKIKIVDLRDILSIKVDGIKPGDQEAHISIRNLENTHLGDLDLSLESDFFKGRTTVSLDPFDEVNVTVPIDAADLQKATAGTYAITTDLYVDGNNVKLVDDFYYLEKGLLAVSENTEGFLVRTTTYEKRNEGNIPIVAEITDTKNLLSRLFTSHTPNPQGKDNNGFTVEYTWRQELAPGQNFVVTSRTNYTLPFILLLLLVAVLFIVKFVTLKPVMVRKQVSVVKTRGGELALRVRINVKARTHVDNLQIIDRVPTIMKLYDKFGIKPDKIDTATRRLIWNLPQLNAGEERVYSYIAYSTVKIVGKIQLPPTTVIFEKSGTSHEVISNTAFLASEKDSD